MKNLFIFILIGLALSLSSCKKDSFYAGNDAVLQFSADTLTFDTVFTSVGSITRFFKVENTRNEVLKLDKVVLKQLPGVQFRINVDGLPGTTLENVEIPAKDYIYIFAEVTVDPNNQNNPFILLDEIEYHYNGVIQRSYLRAWGQNAYFHFGEIIEGDSIWNNDKPHVVVRNDSFPGVGIEAFGSLEIKPGAQVYFSSGSGIFSDGPLIVGAPNCADSVVFQSDRIEDLPNGIDFEERKGLWLGIILRSGATGTFHNTVINNATYGIAGRWPFDDFTDFSLSNQPKLVLDKVKIKNTANTALLCLNAKVEANNCVFFNADVALVTLGMGGNYNFTNCTFNSTGENAGLAVSNFASNGSQGAYGDLSAANFTNCIIYGVKTDELAINNEDAADFNIQFTNSLIRTTLNTDTLGFTNCIINENPRFESASNGDFELQSGSPCLAAGVSTAFLLDYECNAHNNPFDLGAFSN